MPPISRIASARWLTVLMLALSGAAASAYPDEFDVVVYGGTSGGITAAVQAAKMGKKVALVSPTSHLGGLTSSGLGWTDLGNVAILGGLSREFYHRIYLHYSAQPNWSSIKGMAGQGTGFDSTLQVGMIFEPKVAEAIFDGMIAENHVQVFTGLIDLDHGVEMTGQRITAIRLEGGQMFRGKMFIDASYEGDLLAEAGVDFFVGREANLTHGETLSGVQNSASNEIVAGVDPYVVKGNPASGLLAGIKPGVPAENGTADGHLQAYCYRMCLTNKSANRTLVAKPAGYDERDFELVIRAVEQGQRTFFKLDAMPNGKTDSNNSGGISTDYIGRNWGEDWDWTTLNHRQREALAAEHRYWQLGMIWTLQHHPRVLAKVASGIASGWGLPTDEFADNGYFPYQLYVREARRMVSAYVMNMANCTRSRIAMDSIALGAYTMDSHNSTLYNLNGSVKNEGGVGQRISTPYPISYRSIVPRPGQCENLLVPWCLSASHVAFGSIRMEPVFMAIGQSAGTAAVIAIHDGSSVQEVPYDKLAVKLRADGQALTVGSDDTNTTGIIVDNLDDNAVRTGEWTESTSTPGFYGSNYITNGNTGQGTKSVRYTPVIPAAGFYDVSLRWSAYPNRATNVPVKIFHRDGISPAIVNQELNGGTWNVLGSFYFEAGTSGSLLLETTDANEFVIADAAQWTPTGGVGIVDLHAFVPDATRGAGLPAEVIFSRRGSTANALTVSYTTSGTAGMAEVSPAPTGTIVIPAGLREARIPLTALGSTLPLGSRTLQLTLAESSAYRIGAGAVTITLQDPPFDAWRFSNFSTAQLGNAAISGPSADPDGDGRSNLMEFFTGGSGLVADAEGEPLLMARDGNLYLGIRRDSAAADLKLGVWESGDLSNWTKTPDSSAPELYERDGVFQNIGIPLRSGSTFSDGRKFFRIRIEK